MSTNNNHPCYNPEAGVSHGRIHLPVARGCNIQCNYCNRLYDCVNESRPGVTSAVLSPLQAVYYLDNALSHVDVPISVIGIAGPGDPFADGLTTLETLKLVRKQFPEMLLCVATNGLGLPEYANFLADIGVNHVTVTVNAIDPSITAKIISWARYNNRVYRGIEAASLLVERQILAVKELKANNITVKINSIVIPGINDTHIPEVAKTMAALGADVINCLPLHPVESTVFGSIEKPDHDMMQKVRWEVSKHIKVVRHCQMCRADAVGRLGTPNSNSINELLRKVANMPLNPLDNRPYIAVASREGILINEHLGKAEHFYIYSTSDKSFPLIDVRKAPLSGTGLDRWNQLATLLHDCHTLLVNQAGEPPKAVLNEAGIKVIITEGLIDQALTSLNEGVAPVPVVDYKSCNSGGCKGGGQGCG